MSESVQTTYMPEVVPFPSAVVEAIVRLQDEVRMGYFHLDEVQLPNPWRYIHRGKWADNFKLIALGEFATTPPTRIALKRYIDSQTAELVFGCYRSARELFGICLEIRGKRSRLLQPLACMGDALIFPLLESVRTRSDKRWEGLGLGEFRDALGLLDTPLPPSHKVGIISLTQEDASLLDADWVLTDVFDDSVGTTYRVLNPW